MKSGQSGENKASTYFQPSKNYSINVGGSCDLVHLSSVSLDTLSYSCENGERKGLGTRSAIKK